MCKEETGREKWHPQAEHSTVAQPAQAETFLPRKHDVCIPVAAGNQEGSRRIISKAEHKPDSK